MRSPGLAFAWEFRRQHRWGLIAVAGYVLALGATRLFVLEPGAPADLGDSPSFVATVVVPLTSAFLYLLAVFSFGLGGDVAARQSMYPARVFTLPVTTGELAGWPMLFGTVAAAGLWLATAAFALRPSGVEVPLVWPALFAAVFLAWTQVLMWTAYGLPGLRAIASVLWLVVIDLVAVLAFHFQPPELLMVAVLAPQLPVASLAARAAVGRARRGDVPDWRVGLARLGRVLPHPRRPFPSPDRAQTWLEWRRHGWSLPAWVGILLPFELALLFVAGDAPALVFFILLVVLLTPPVMAAFAAVTVRQVNPLVSDAYGVMPFLATRPATSAALVAAKLKVTIWSTVAAWLLVLVAVPLVLVLSDTWPVVLDRARRVSEAIGTPRAVVIGLLGWSGLMAATWKQLVQSLYLGLSGRAWLVKASIGLTLAVLFAIVPLVQWVRESSDLQAALWRALRWVPAVLVVLKMAAAAWVVTRLQRARLLSDRTLVRGAVSWLGAVLALYGLLVWLLATPHTPRYFLALVAILAIPLVRLSAAPLALAWNRHR